VHIPKHIKITGGVVVVVEVGVVVEVEVLVGVVDSLSAVVVVVCNAAVSEIAALPT
jgi:hypothetical protein